MAANLKFIFQSFWLNIKKELQYKTSFIIKIVMMIANDAFFIVQWLVIFSIVDNVGGYGLREVMTLWAITAGAYGVAHTFLHGATRFGGLVYNGKLDVFLTQPKNVLISVACSRTDVSAIGDMIYSFVALAIGGAAWWWYIAIVPIAILSGLIYVSVSVIISSLCFYIPRGHEVGRQFRDALLKFGNYPINIFSFGVRLVLFTVIPAAFFSFLPAEFLFNLNWLYLLYYVLFCCGAVCLAFICFNVGVRRYSSGSLGGGRV